MLILAAEVEGKPACFASGAEASDRIETFLVGATVVVDDGLS
jgi:hypothetical protein